MVPLASGVVEPQRPGGRPAVWAATGRSGGVSRPPFDGLNLAGYVGDDPAAVEANLAQVARLVDVPAGQLAVLDAVHGAHVGVVDEPGLVPGADAAVTRRTGLGLVALAADCVPLALVADDDHTIAVVHCGWRGLVADVVSAAVLALDGAGIRAAILGPSVCGRCYPVPPVRADEVRRSCPAEVAAAALVVCADGQPGIDVGRGVQARLVGLGCDPTAVTVVGGCTVEDAGLYSYRRDGVTGRQGIAVARMGS